VSYRIRPGLPLGDEVARVAGKADARYFAREK